MGGATRSLGKLKPTKRGRVETTQRLLEIKTRERDISEKNGFVTLPILNLSSVVKYSDKR